MHSNQHPIISGGSSTPVVFQFQQFPINVILKDGEPWFIASEVCAALGMTVEATRRLDADEKGLTKIQTPGGEQDATILSEPGLYRLIGRSNKPAAKAFNRWACHEVFPAIRKTGRYEALPYAANPGDTLTKDEADTLRAMLTEAAERLPKDRQKALMLQGWSKLKAHFKTDYRHIPRAEFPEAVSLVARHIAGFAAAPADDLIPKSHALRCFALASAVTTGAQAAALSQLLDCGEDEVRHGRFLVTFCNGVPKVLAIERDAHVASLSRLAEMIAEPNGILPSNAELANLAKACVDRIAARINSAIEVREAA